MLQIYKKDGTLEEWKDQKIINAVNKAASRVMINLTDEDYANICDDVEEVLSQQGIEDIVTVEDMHNAVEEVLNDFNPRVAESYRNYRNYKSDFIHMLDKVYVESQKIRYIGDKDNANTDSALVATKRCLIFNQLNGELYKKFFLTKEELQAMKDGYIYIHDRSARLDTFNCCLFRVGEVMKNGFEMGNIFYEEPNSLDTAFDVMGDIILSTAAQQYGGFTVPQVDKILAPYAEKSYNKYVEEYKQDAKELLESLHITFAENLFKPIIENLADKRAMKKVEREFEQGWQGIEYKLNTVGSSRGDYPFTTMTYGLATDKFGKMASITFMKVHQEGQGKKGFKKPVLFPKLVFLYDSKLHGEGCINEDVFEAGIECSSRTMYPDWLSLEAGSYIGDMYQKYGEVISPMGKCKLAHVKSLEPIAYGVCA